MSSEWPKYLVAEVRRNYELWWDYAEAETAMEWYDSWIKKYIVISPNLYFITSVTIWIYTSWITTIIFYTNNGYYQELQIHTQIDYIIKYEYLIQLATPHYSCIMWINCSNTNCLHLRNAILKNLWLQLI